MRVYLKKISVHVILFYFFFFFVGHENGNSDWQRAVVCEWNNQWVRCHFVALKVQATLPIGTSAFSVEKWLHLQGHFWIPKFCEVEISGEIMLELNFMLSFCRQQMWHADSHCFEFPVSLTLLVIFLALLYHAVHFLLRHPMSVKMFKNVSFCISTSHQSENSAVIR